MSIRKILQFPFVEIRAWLVFLLIWIPGTIGTTLRSFFYKPFFRSCGKNVNISQGCVFREFKNISIGDNVGFGQGCQVYASGGGGENIEIGNDTGFNSNVMINADLGGNVIIGEKCSIGPNVVMRASNHSFADKTIPIQDQGHIPGVITINDGVWIGANAVIVPNVKIGKGVIVGAGAVVTKNVDEFTVVGGVPAKMIKIRE